MDATRQRPFVPALAILTLLALGWLLVHRSQAAPPDPLNDARRALVDTCAQRDLATYATWCVPDGWTLEARPPGNDPGAPNIESTKRDNTDPGGARLHLSGPRGQVAQLQVAILPGLSDAEADELGRAPNAAARHAVIERRMTERAGSNPAMAQAGGVFLPDGTVPHADVYRTTLGSSADAFPEWFVFRGRQMISIIGMPGYNGGSALPLPPTDLPTVTAAVDRILATWAWTDDWADAPDLTQLEAEHAKD